MVLKLLHELDIQTAPEANIDKKVILNKVGEKAFWLHLSFLCIVSVIWLNLLMK